MRSVPADRSVLERGMEKGRIRGEEDGHLRLEDDMEFSISFFTIAGCFLLALIKVVTPAGGLRVSYETKITSVFAAYAPTGLAKARIDTIHIDTKYCTRHSYFCILNKSSHQRLSRLLNRIQNQRKGRRGVPQREQFLDQKKVVHAAVLEGSIGHVELTTW